MKKLIVVLLMCGSVLFLSIYFFKSTSNPLTSQENYNKILYSWKLSDVQQNNEKFYSILNDYDINVIYQDFTSQYLSSNDCSFIKDMNDRGVVVYHLAGDPSWGRKDGSESIIKEILKVQEYNLRVTNKIQGIVFDIEPYVSEKEEVFSVSDFQIYVDQIKNSYDYAKGHNIKFILAIPYWFDSIDKDLLEELFRHSDGVSVMNYGTSKTNEHIINEIKLAKKYNISIDSIYEVEYGEDGYFSSKEDIFDDFKLIRDNNDYKNLGISFHHFGSFLKNSTN